MEPVRTLGIEVRDFIEIGGQDTRVIESGFGRVLCGDCL